MMTRMARACLVLSLVLIASIGVSSARQTDSLVVDLEEAKELTRSVVELHRQGKYEEALPSALQALAVHERILGPDHLDVAVTLGHLARLHDALGDYAQAEALFQRALEIRARALGPEHLEVAVSLNDVAEMARKQAAYARSESLGTRALSVAETAAGREHPEYARALNNLALVYVSRGDFARAAPLFASALAIRELELGPENPDVARSLNNLGLVYQTMGEYGRATPLFERALAIREKVFGPNHPIVARSLNNLAMAHQAKGEYALALPLLERSLAIREQSLGPNHRDVATALNNLALVCLWSGDHTRAEPLFQRSLAIVEQSLGPTHPQVGTALHNLAEVHRAKGEPALAEPLYLRALAIVEASLGPEHPDYAFDLNNLAKLYLSQRDYARAESLFTRVLTIRENSLGPEHPEMAKPIRSLAAIQEVRGRTPEAIALQARACEIEERHLRLILASGSDEEKLAFASTLEASTFMTVSLHTRSASADPEAARLALRTILHRKGAVLEATSESLALLRRRMTAEDLQLFEELAVVRSSLATLVNRGPRRLATQEYREQCSQLEHHSRELEEALSARSAEFRRETQPVTIERLRSALPEGTALLEVLSYEPYDVRSQQWSPAWYVAYVLRRSGEPRWVELGEVAVIDRKVEALRAALAVPGGKGSTAKARDLDEMLMRPIRAFLDDESMLILSLDGSLNLLPFAALVDEDGHFLVERLGLVHVTSGRDLLKMRHDTSPGGEALVLASPDFDASGESDQNESTDAKAQQGSSTRLQSLRFGPLPGAKDEAVALGTILDDARILTGAEATEEALKAASGPRILHIATHGFFLGDRTQVPLASRGVIAIESGAVAAGANATENPLLRAGLALAGANVHSSGGDNGILTALEASGLDLWGTKLVVLSACETGVGEVRNGEGVYGLRRAFALAGAESHLMSLWKVSDDATRDLMVEYYRRLLAGEGRSEALRQVQLEMLRSEDQSHPFYWAAFILTGAWSGLSD